MSLFGDLDINEIPDDPFAMPDNDYMGYISKCEVRTPKNKPDAVSNLVVTCQATEGQYEGYTAQRWFPIPESLNTADEKRQAAFLKQFLSGMGVPESRLNDFQPDELDGVKVIFTVKNSEGTGDNAGKTYKNVTQIKINE